MYIIDLHCDVLFKLWESQGKLRFKDAKELDANKERLHKGKVKVQCFAIFIPPEMKAEEKFQAALDQVDYFFTEVVGKNKDIRHIKNWNEITNIKSNEVGAILTLEGVDCIGNDLHKLSILYHLGVRSVGLTWNFANLAADGVLEPRGAGLTTFGKEIVLFNNKHKVFTDVSHLCENSFWDVMEWADYPIASHSNSKFICNHPRNLSDEQACALFQKNAMIHVVYHPPFVTTRETATITDLIRHIDHFCALGGEYQIGFGSDFDGIEEHIIDLENAGKHQNLINELLKHYREDQVRGFAGENFLQHLPM